MSAIPNPEQTVSCRPLSPSDYETRVGSSIPGWLQPTDVRALRAVDHVQRELAIAGDVVEIGTFMGRSAILLGSLLRADEELIVTDLWDQLPFDPAEWDCIDGSPQQSSFEANYLRFHPRLPRVLTGSSTTSLETIGDATCRLVHVDGSHEHEIVTLDVATARRISGPGGVMVFDDHMNPRHPGVAAAVWSAVDRGELRPLALTTSKLYAVSPETAIPLDALDAAARELGLSVAHRACCGWDTLRFDQPTHAASAWVPPALKPALRAVQRRIRHRT